MSYHDATNKTIISVNPALQQLFGFTEAEALDKRPPSRSGQQHSSDFYQQIWQMLAATTLHRQGEILNHRKDGDVIPLQLSISAVFDEQQNVSHYAAIFTDLSQIRATEAEMEFLAGT